MPAESASEKRERVLHRFAHELSAASGLPEAARLLAQAADDLLGWDCCILNLWDEEKRDFVFVYAVDIIEGKRTEVPVEFPPTPTAMLREVAAHGSKLILRDGSSDEEPKLIPFGDMKRRSASLLFVPIRQGGRVFGLFTSQSYTPQAYSQDDLTLLQTLADYGTGAIERIRVQEQLHASEERLRANHDRFRLALEVAAMGTWDWNIMSGEVFCSDNLGPLFGLPASGYFADYRVFINRIVDEDRPALEAALQRSLESGQPFSHEVRVNCGEGLVSWLLNQGRCYPGPDGKIARMVGATVDITERRQAQEALRSSEERFAKVFHSGMAAISIADLETGRYVEVNERWLELLGFTRTEVLGRTGLDLGVWPVPEDRERMLAALHSEGALRDWQCRWIRKDGQVIDAITSFETMEMGGRQFYIGLTHDITEKLKLEDELRQAHRMETVGQLAAGIAHDFNNILTIISGGAALILSDRLDAEVSRNATRQIQFAADRAAGLTRQLLTFSRRQVIQRRDLDLNAAAANVTQLLANTLGENIELETQFTPGLPLIHADPGMIEQVIMNLAVNARDAMPRGGHLTLRTELNETDTTFLTRRSGARRGRFVVLVVSDNGTGIGSEHLPRIFDPFFTTKEVGKGTGLGLATVYGIAKQHDGWVDVESLAGEGTTFRVFFPAVDSPVTGTAPVAAEHPRGGGERILLVEDEPMLRALAEQILHLNGYTVTSAADGPEARQFWRECEGDFHLLVTDMVMPRGLTGGELAAELQRERAGLKVVLMSGYSREIVDPDAAFDASTRFLQKPYLPEELLHAVRAALDGGVR